MSTQLNQPAACEWAWHATRSQYDNVVHVHYVLLQCCDANAAYCSDPESRACATIGSANHSTRLTAQAEATPSRRKSPTPCKAQDPAAAPWCWTASCSRAVPCSLRPCRPMCSGSRTTSSVRLIRQLCKRSAPLSSLARLRRLRPSSASPMLLSIGFGQSSCGLTQGPSAWSTELSSVSRGPSRRNGLSFLSLVFY